MKGVLIVAGANSARSLVAAASRVRGNFFGISKMEFGMTVLRMHVAPLAWLLLAGFSRATATGEHKDGLHGAWILKEIVLEGKALPA